MVIYFIVGGLEGIFVNIFGRLYNFEDGIVGRDMFECDVRGELVIGLFGSVRWE